MSNRRTRPSFSWVLAWTVSLGLAQTVAAQTPEVENGQPPIEFKVGSAERLEMTVNTSRILSMDQKIPRAQVNNPDLLELTPIGAKQVQIHAKKTGFTQVNLWDEKGNVHPVDVSILGDVKELAGLLKANFPSASVHVQPTTNSVILTGYVDNAALIKPIIRIAEDYYPKVINNIIVGGAQQVMLHVKVMEVSRTKLRTLGFDFANFASDGSFAISGIGGLLRNVGSGAVATSGAETFAFGLVDGGNQFFGILEALQRNSCAKLLAEPTLITVSGRPAYFQSGGEIPVLIPQGLGNVSVEFRPFGTQVDFVPIVMGQDKVKLEVRPRVSEIDRSLSVTLNGSSIPGFRTRTVDTGVEMRFGQTLALAGLIQQRVESEKRGFPWLMDIPVVGMPFRRVTETSNEIELLVMVRPELGEALDPHEVPPCGPGDSTMSPNDCQLYLKGFTEVPNPRCAGCGSTGCNGGGACKGSCNGEQMMGPGVEQRMMNEMPVPSSSQKAAPRQQNTRMAQAPQNRNTGRTATTAPPAQSAVRPAASTAPAPMRTAPAPAASSRPAAAPYNPPVRQTQQPTPAANGQNGEPGLIGPTGYDVIN